MLVVGNYIKKVKCESCYDSDTNRIRIRPLENQGLPTDVFVECLRDYRNTNLYPLGTIFIAEDLKICQKPIGRIYLRAKDQLLTRL